VEILVIILIVGAVYFAIRPDKWKSEVVPVLDKIKKIFKKDAPKD
jgi:hypothetical protein